MTYKKTKLLFMILFLFGNIVVINHAYRFTHFSESGERLRPEELSSTQKIKTLLCGVENPRPRNDEIPKQNFSTVQIQSNELLEGWLIEQTDARGLVILFHGYSSSKSGCLEYSDRFYELGYSTLLIDFQGSGGSTGNKTTVGVEESYDVKSAIEYVEHNYSYDNIILFGSSMGAASILKAIDEFEIKPNNIIIECPFSTMKATMQKRFEVMSIPSFPATEILLFYGGVINGFNPFDHNPVDYAKGVEVPTLLLHGRNDKRVLVSEVEAIYRNLNGPKHLKILENCGHEVYLDCNADDWINSIKNFL